MIKSKKEVTLKTRETYLFTENLKNQKLLKLFSKFLLKIVFFLGKFHSAEKQKGAIYRKSSKLGVAFEIG